jgi:hypothetical protein
MILRSSFLSLIFCFILRPFYLSIRFEHWSQPFHRSPFTVATTGQRFQGLCEERSEEAETEKIKIEVGLGRLKRFRGKSKTARWEFSYPNRPSIEEDFPAPSTMVVLSLRESFSAAKVRESLRAK